ncbi:MAG TPA: tRNA glutamyl-Q(34) synthetase GluQRS [Methylococcus sp.]|nr:tRNA glutamyl-Q(34) synthetase GluQRS [Methylococcus sp.]
MHRPSDTASPASSYRGRFAPSPTGPLHLGSLFTALVSCLEARKRSGKWLVRIDDLDRQRCSPSHADGILRTLERHGLYWDETVLHQSQRDDRYREALERLKSSGRAFPCTCPRRLALQAGPRYPGTCRGRSFETIGGEHAIRLRVEHTEIEIHDRVQGRIRCNLEVEAGDFVIHRRDGIPAYHLATVVDDAEQGITEVVRGVDLLESTPKQVYLQKSLALPTPNYGHIPVLTDRSGIKLSKQTGAPAVDGRHPTRNLLSLLDLLDLRPGADLRTATPSEILAWAVEHWDLDLLPKQPALPVDDL